EYSIGVSNFCDYYDLIHSTMTLVGNAISGGSGDLFSMGVVNQGTLTMLNSNIDGGSCTDISVGMVSNRGTATLVNNTIDGGSGTGLSAGVFWDNTYFPSEMSLIHNNLWGQDQLGLLIYRSDHYVTDVADVNACQWDGCMEAFGNISTDPLFVDPAGDFHLLRPSPCIDAGINPVPNYATSGFVDFDFDGDPRPYGAGWDIGADEWRPGAR
ncbi:MAG: hypothetical protein GY869_09575, partial [Planctomycetes bacterium]|nr:hypothetical protein [Planctomycetota bacterium]